MTPITANLLEAAVGCGRTLANTWAKPLVEACALYEITTPARLAAFLAQIGHESSGLSKTTENLNYGANGLTATWPKRFDAATAAEYARQPQRIANKAYADRMGNGPESSRDGWKYRGRGLIQVTGKANYEAVRDLLRDSRKDVPDLVDDPDALSEPRWAALSAAAWWHSRDLNDLADRGAFTQITGRINGAQTGAADRKDRYERARKALIGA